jgi:DNA polymerase-3 subunit delta'
MAFKNFPAPTPSIELLQRSLARRRLGHAYLFFGEQLENLDSLARTLAKTLNCQNPILTNGVATDCCDECPSCKKIDNNLHPDVHLIKPQAKSRIIEVDNIRELIREINLRPTEGGYKIAIISDADRMTNPASKNAAANAFLKTLEEPPPKSILILLSTEPSRILETILSRCLRLNFARGRQRELNPVEADWLEKFSALAAREQKSLLGRYRLLDALLQRLGEIRTHVSETLTAHSPLEKYDNTEKELREKWEDELTAAIEAEYRRQRTHLLLLLQFWLRDIWLQSLAAGKELFNFPKIFGAEIVAQRINSRQAQENLQTLEQTQRLLYTNVQEALALEVGLLKLNL